MKKQFREVIKISRPRFWIYLAGPYLIGFTIAANELNDFKSLEFIYLFIFFLLPANLILYGINDFFDSDTDFFNLKKSHKENKKTEQNKNLYKNIIFSSILFSIVPLLFLNLKSNLMLIIFLLLSLAYSAPPLRFKSKPILDSSSNILYIIPGIIGYTQLTNTYPPLSIIFLCFLWTFSMHLFSAIPDINADNKAQINTTATFLGFKKSLFLCFLLWGVLSFILIYMSPLFIFSAIYPLMALTGLLVNKSNIDKIYWAFPFVNLIIGFLLFIFFANKFI